MRVTTPAQLAQARQLRRDQTPQEATLWRELRGRRFENFKFRHQRPIGRYVVDFICLERRLVIEIDGGQHANARGRDTARDAYLARNGYRVLRFWNNDVSGNLPGVLETIDAALRADPHPNPLP